MCWILLQYSDLNHSKNISTNRTVYKLVSGVISALLSLIVSITDSTFVKKSVKVLVLLIIGLLYINRTEGNYHYQPITCYDQYNICIAVRFGENDVYIREGDPPRSLAFERTETDLTKPAWVEVYVTTIEEYKLREYRTSGCNLSLADLGIDESLDDPAEGSYMNFCYSYTYRY